MQHKDDELIRLCVARPHACSDDFSEFETFHLLGDALEILWIVILAVDENNLFGAPRNIEFSLVDNAEVTRAQPAVNRERDCIRLRILVVALRDVFSADMNVPDLPIGKRAIIIVGDANATVRNGASDSHVYHSVLVARRHGLHALARAQAVTIERDRTIRPADGREAYGQRGFREAVHRKHCTRARGAQAPSGRGTRCTGRPKLALRR